MELIGKRLIALICCILIVMLPLAVVAETDTTVEKFDEQQTGESIIVNMKSYEPTVLTSNLIEEDDVDVYAFLTGYTPGSAMAKAGKFSQQANEPFYAQPAIKNVVVRPLDAKSEGYLKNTKYSRPIQYTLDDLGTVIISLKRIPAEKDVPSELTINLSAQIYFENAERLFNMIQQDLVIPEDNDEAAWKEKSPEEYAFFSGRGFLRATSIDATQASFKVYETQGFKEQSSGFFSTIAIFVKQFLQTRTVTLKIGETSDYVRLSAMSFVPENAFRIKLNSITNPQDAKARARVSVDGKTQSLVLYEGMPIFNGASYKVKRIEVKAIQGGQKRYELTIQGPQGTYTATKTISSTEQNVLLAQAYKGNNKTILSFPLSDIQAKLNKYYPGAKYTAPISILSSDLTREYEIKKEVTLAETLAHILPPRYTFVENQGKVEIKAAETTAAKDVCNTRVTVIKSEDDVTNGAMENIMCTAISNYKELISSYGNDISKRGVSYRDEANYKIGKLYFSLYNILLPEEQINAAESALLYMKQAASNPAIREGTDAQDTINSLQNDIEVGAQYSPIIFEDNGREITVTLADIIPTLPSQMPHATIQVEEEGKKTFGIGDSVVSTKDFTWRIKSITSNDVTLEKVALTQATIQTTTVAAEPNIVLRMKTSTAVGNKSLNLQDTQLNKMAYVSILPGTGKPLISQTNFSIHIPIEKRTIPLSPETIDKQLNQTQHWIDELDKITTKLESVVKTWNTVCLATFAFLTIKNSFFMGLTRTQARKDAVYGPDGRSGWTRYCAENSGEGRKYASNDECMRANEATIEKQIDETQKVINDVDSSMKDYQNQQWYKALMADYKQVDKYGNYVGKEEFFTQDELKAYRYYQLTKETQSYSSLAGQQGAYDLKKEVDVSFGDTNTKTKQAYNQAVDAIMQKYPNIKNKEEEQQIFNDIYKAKLQETKTNQVTSDEFRELSPKTVTVVPLLRKDSLGTAFINTPTGKLTLQQATVTDYITALRNYEKTVTDKQNIENEIDRISKKYSKNLNAPLSANKGLVYVDNMKKLYTSEATYDLGQINTVYKIKKVEVYPDGKPYCVPTTNGNYVKVLDFFADGSPKTVQEWNIGPDGTVCSQDDIPIKHETLLNLPENEPEQRALRSKASRIGTHSAGEVVTIGGQEFTVSTSTAKASAQSGQASCYDVMDPDDCATLFGVCDPVMCPVSRFNLGGTYQVDNVVQSGIIGSLVLGLDNFNAKEPVPICLTGILAGLKNIKSVLQGYVQCLKEAQTTGKSVGICDQLRSIFICDIVYKEVISLFNAKGGIINWLAKKAFGQGGGEYLSFQNSLQNVQKSVSFFTQQYAKTAFAAYRGRTTEELGKTICSVAIYGKLPKLGEVMDQLTTPESPPQFMAKLTASPYSQSARINKESYNIFYHIYAGEDRKAQFTVFLRDRAENTYYATDKCNGRSGEIQAGGISSQSLDCVADAGYDEICVTINGVTQCGFGKVTSVFSLNYLNDLVVQDEASKKITTEEECVPDNSRYSSPLYSAIPVASAYASTGIVRVCSVQNPGQGTSPESWKSIGTCGKDNAGRTLGSCWMDLRTVTIRDTETMANTQRALQEAGLNITKKSQGITQLLDKEQAEAELARLAGEPKSTVPQMLDLLQGYNALEQASLSLAVAAEAKYQASSLYEELSYNSLPPLHAIPGKAVVTAETQVAKAAPGKASAQATKEIEAACVACDSDPLGFCTLSECHKLSQSCVYRKNREILSGVFANIGALADDECHACGTATRCEYFNDDRSMCERIECTGQAGLHCKWMNIFNEEQCIDFDLPEEDPNLAQIPKVTVPTMGNIVAIPKIGNVKCSATDCRINSALIPKLQEASSSLTSGETLKIISAYRTPEQQRTLFIEYLKDQTKPPTCGPNVPREESSVNLPAVQDLNSYIKSQCPHIIGGAIDIYLCDSSKNGQKDQSDKICGNDGYENSERLQEIMCNSGWVSYAPERWHYEYGTLDWKQVKLYVDANECLFGAPADKANRPNIQVVSPVVAP